MRQVLSCLLILTPCARFCTPQITAEFIATALLVFTVFAVLDPGRNQTVIHVAVLGPFAIGMAVFVAHLALIPIDGATARAGACIACVRC